jgi:hypothetical protein
MLGSINTLAKSSHFNPFANNPRSARYHPHKLKNVPKQ